MIPLTETESCPSTSDECWRMYGEGRRTPVAVWSRTQGAGRGTHGRSWFTPPRGNVSLSVLLFPRRDDRAMARFAPLRMALGAAEILGRLAGLNVAIKWPNDLMLKGRKLGGILVETRITPAEGPVPMVVGLGINLNSRRDDFPETLRPLVATLGDESGTVQDERGVVEELLAMIEGGEGGRG